MIANNIKICASSLGIFNLSLACNTILTQTIIKLKFVIRRKKKLKQNKINKQTNKQKNLYAKVSRSLHLLQLGIQ